MPANGAVLNAAPATITLRFLAKVSAPGTTVNVIDPAGAPATGGPARVEGVLVVVPLHPTVPGAYTVSYQVASADGHPVRGKVTFTLTSHAVPTPQQAAPPAPVATPTAAPTGSVSPTGDASAEPAAPAASSGAGTSLWWLLAVVGLAVVVTAGVVLHRARRTDG
jgi:methionine-rich copper-binding protein CopC